jgi:hypothetical protein
VALENDIVAGGAQMQPEDRGSSIRGRDSGVWLVLSKCGALACHTSARTGSPAAGAGGLGPLRFGRFVRFDS